MKKVLIISPYFPPSNAADMQRIRMSLPYLKNFGWDAEVVTVDEQYADIVQDTLLTESVPHYIKIHKVKALNKTLTSKFGLGSLGLRSLWFYRKKVNRLLSNNKFDLIYFSTTQFAVCTLGAYWKKRFGVPYVIDMQDPWHSEYYRDKPKEQKPRKYWLSYPLNKYMEGIAMKAVDGIISVSESYITDLKQRYPAIQHLPTSTITFGYFEPDMDIALKHQNNFPALLAPGYKNLVYVGRGGMDMRSAVTPVFTALQQLFIMQPDLIQKLRLYFIGTSYSPAGAPTIRPVAALFGAEDNVIEITDRISYYHTLATLLQADALFIPGSDDPRYTASKIYPYLMAKKPLLAVFNSKSPALAILHNCEVQQAYSYDDTPALDDHLQAFFKALENDTLTIPELNGNLKEFDAQNMTKKQCDLFNLVLTK